MTAPNAAHVHTPERAVRAASGPPPVPAERHADFRAAALETAARLGAGLGGDLALVPTHAPAGGVRALLGGGTPLPVAVRTEEEARFGLPLDDVRVHDNPAAHRLATRHLARALTIGRDIVFNDGHYRPDSSTGRGLLAHELAHAVQQRTATGAGPASPAHEAAADAAALAAVSGGPVHRRAVHAGPPASVGVQAAPLSRAEIAVLLLPQLTARIAENEREASTLVITEAYRAELGREHTWLLQRYTALAGARRSTADEPQPTPPLAYETLAAVESELVQLEPLALHIIADAPVHPRDHALNTVRGVLKRAQGDQDFIRQFAAQGGATAPAARTAATRVQRLVDRLTPVAAQAEQWHTANPAGQSLGMRNEALGTSLAGTALADWERGGWYYLRGAAAFVGAGGIALVDAGEQLLSFGYHDAATAVSEAYTRGDISWNEGESILWNAAWRAVLTAAITRGAGAATSRLGAAATRAAGLAPRTVGAGLLSGGVAGGAAGAATLGAQAVLTTALQNHFASPAGRAIWQRGMPSGTEWALAIPLGIVLGAAAGARAVRLGNEKLIGSTVTTSYGEDLRIVAITPEGQVVLEPVAGLRTPPPAPPPSTTVDLVYDPASRAWRPLRPPGSVAGAGAGGAKPAAPGAPGAAADRPPALPQHTEPPAPGSKPAPPTEPGSTVKPSAAPTAAVPALPPAPAPVTPKTTAAGVRVAETQQALTAAARETALARAEVATATSELQSAQAGRRPGGPTARQAQDALRRAENRLARLMAGEATARAEATAAAQAQSKIVRLETAKARLIREITAELHPPQGFTPEQVRAGRKAGVVPSTGSPAGAEYRRLTAELAAVEGELATEVQGLRRSVADRVAAAAPGRAGRAPALRNAEALPTPLRPVNGTPVDVTTGQPLTGSWEVDHLVPRAEIARDPRFARLSPLQQDSILLDVPENYLPMSKQANLSKSDWTVNEWIARRAADGRPLPAAIAEALREADRLARAAIEARFGSFLGR
ncbi:DUF4157 domain-containing protein [Kitasatospora sp. CM 4170]|uniref:DUF4157 domain-containing protein n=1 Tax=Kitasatospora aburaviensis TaxID=67265 RepID=A0ABW1EQH9_9ACTN|nr:DUF4157 domain-containing protein [Kitasatospora sp. CM 4170]WNM44439.1 DUF4157 domain-containing protein [Kitasatospora sp. CM 4170]